jgi:hypothetical protein
MIILNELLSFGENRMDNIKELRKANLRSLINSRYDGKISRMAEAIDRQPAYLSRIYSDDPRHVRHIGENMARDIEGKLNIQAGWLDINHTQDHPQAKYRHKGEMIADRWNEIPDLIRSAIVLLVQHALEDRPSGPGKGKLDP